MKGINKVIIVGTLGKDPETRYFPNGDAVANVSVATSEEWTDKASGEKKSHTEWHSVVFQRKLAEIAGQWLLKGSKVYLEGKLRTRKWQDKDTGKDRFSTEILVSEMQMLSSKEQTQESAPTKNKGKKEEPKSKSDRQQPPEQFEDDPIPF